MKDDRLYLLYIRDSIARISEYVADGKEAFFADPKTQDAVIRNMQTLAESSQRLSAALRARYPEVDWRGLAGLRNVLVHDYLGIHLVRVWQIVERNLPGLKEQVEAMLKESANVEE